MSERQDILDAIRDAGTITKAAKRLGIHRRTLQDRMRAHGIPRGKRGRPKRRVRYSRAAKRYAIPTIAAAVVGGFLLSRRQA